MAEAHPVGFQWVMEAKARGAKVIHVDPRFTRTSALADTYVPIRAGTDIALPRRRGALHPGERAGLPGVRASLHQRGDDRQRATSATPRTSTGSSPGSTRRPAPTTRRSWQYAGQEDRRPGAPGPREERETASRAAARVARRSVRRTRTERDETLQHPRCVYQILKRHFARYTPEMVERVCGIPQETFLEVCEAWTENSGRERTGALVYSVGWTQHSVGVQYIRTGAIIQLLLGNIGPAGRRDPGAARARQHPGLDRHPDAVQPAARLPADAAPRRGHPTFDEWVDSIRHPGAEGLLGQRAGLRGQPAQGVLG